MVNARPNVELVRDAFAAFDRGGIDAVLPFVDEDVTVHSLPEWPDDAEYHGHDGFRKLSEAWTENFEDFGFEVADIREGRTAVVALLRMKGRARASGLDMADEIGAVFSRFRGGAVGEIRYLPSWDEALAQAR